MHSEVGLELPDSDRNMCHHEFMKLKNLLSDPEELWTTTYHSNCSNCYEHAPESESWAQTATTRLKLIGHKSNAEIKRKLGKPLCNVSKTFSILVHLY